MSLYLDKVLRTLWAEMGEPDRPTLGELGQHDGRAATGPDHTYNEARDGSTDAWKLRKEADRAEAAEAAAWRERHGEPPDPWYEAGQEEEEEEEAP
jgi:hypothetical protein